MTKIHEVLIVGGGASGLATASSLRKRNPHLDITVIEPAEKHYYQPGWTMVGAGVFNKEQTERTMDSVWPSGIKRIKSKVVTFEPDNSLVTITSGEKISYKTLVVAAGLK
ncbi:MAG: FAD/NAD(P)-binding oxidoreductase, partial [Paracoccaceae bacterium]|nr:FAD/NAD(P)-binding oxidoreductase [Paracoccaceae bacterium]